jgi:multicomponent Na+:H+ antiporter subunit G
MLIEAIAALLLILGVTFCVLGIYGIFRLDDLYNRLHAAGLIVTLGASSIMLALLLIGPPKAGIKGMATAFFLLITGPLVTHVLARTAHIKGARIGQDSAEEAPETGDIPNRR